MVGRGSPLAEQSSLTECPSLQVELLGATSHLGGRFTLSEAV